jgi:hypothetical protein
MQDTMTLPAGLPFSADEWSGPVHGFSFRVWPAGATGLRLWRKETGAHFYGGYQIKHCHVSSRIAEEWLKQWQLSKADAGHPDNVIL